MTARNDSFLEAADAIGRKLCRDAIWAGDRCNWLGYSMAPVNGTWNLAYRAQTSTLYDGTAGVALFLSMLYQFTNDEAVKDAAMGALNHAVGAMQDGDANLRAGLFSGPLGIAYVCIEAGKVFAHEAFIHRGLKYLEDLRQTEPSDTGLDICNGSAGAIQVLIDMAGRHRPDLLLETAITHGHHLVRKAVKTDEGISWDTMPGFSSKNVLGYAHGTSGIACALLELWAVTGKNEFRDTAVEALRYERANFNQAHGNWPDFRVQDQPAAAQGAPAFMLAWCHGAPGVGLGKLRAYQLLGADETLAAELQAALQATVNGLAASLPAGHGNFSLCHGAGGNADLLLLAGEALSKSELTVAAETVGQNGIAQYHDNDLPWACGVSTGFQTPNLMLGLSGIGYYYLRLYAPEKVPSVLLIAPRGDHNGNGEAEGHQEAVSV